MKTLKDFNFQNKKVLIRCDFNVPINECGDILNDFRIKETIPTLKYLIAKGASLILISHLGDPQGKIVEGLRLNKIKEVLNKYLGFSIEKTNDCIGKEVQKKINQLNQGEVLLLENVRFYKEEEENDESFAKNLANLADIYINEAFSVCHRNHASVSGVAKFLPSGAGLLLEKEINVINKLKDNPEKPLVVIIGGKKVETKSKLIDNFSDNAEWILVGGLLIKEIKDKNLKLKKPEIILGPVDIIDENLNIKKIEEINNEPMPDIGPETIKIFKEKIQKAKTIFWNGPLGKTEEEKFTTGSKEIAKAIVDSKAFSVVGGGETVEFITKQGIFNQFGHVSTGGGAMMAYLGGEQLPGLKALEK